MNIIERGYKLFQQYHISKIENACTFCCLNEEEINQLINLTIRDISVELLSTYNDSAQAYEPEIREFKHFLPRYLDLVYGFEFPSHSVELSLRNISNYNPNQWTEEEWDFLNEFVVDFFKKCLTTRPIPNNYDGLSPILIMINKAGFAISPFLEIWEKDNGIIGCLHYKELLTSDFNWMKKRKLGNAFSTMEQSEIIYDWSNQSMIKKKYLKKIEEIIVGDFDLEEKDLNELSWLYDILTLNIS